MFDTFLGTVISSNHSLDTLRTGACYVSYMYLTKRVLMERGDNPRLIIAENHSRSFLYGDEGTACCISVHALMNNVMKSTRCDRKSIPMYGEVYRLNLISATSATWNRGKTETYHDAHNMLVACNFRLALTETSSDVAPAFSARAQPAKHRIKPPKLMNLAVVFSAFAYYAKKSPLVGTAFRSLHMLKLLWAVDSGATKHVVNDRSMLTDFEPIDASIIIGDGKALAVTGRGTLRFEAYDVFKKVHTLVIYRVWLCEDLTVPLFSMRCWTKEAGNGAVFSDPHYGDCLRRGPTVFPLTARGDEYVWHIMIKMPVLASARVALADRPPASVSAISLKPASPETWHNRLGHIALTKIHRTAKHQCVHGLVITATDTAVPPKKCGACIEAGLKPTPRKRIPLADSLRSKGPLDLVHIDGLFMKILSFGCIYSYTFTDDWSRIRAAIGVRYKSQFLSALQRFIQLYMYALKSGHTVKTIVINCIQTDGASELVEGATRQWCEANQITIQISAPGVAQENGIAEKSNDLIKKMAKTIHKYAGFLPHFWLLSMNLATHILMFSTPELFGGKVTCYERMFGCKPDISHLRVPGCLVYYYSYQLQKKSFFEDNARKGVLVGYCTRSRTYLIYSCETKRVIRSAEVVFNEDYLPFLHMSQPLHAAHSATASADLRLHVPAHLQWSQKDGDPVHIITLGPTVSSKPRELLGAD